MELKRENIVFMSFISTIMIIVYHNKVLSPEEIASGWRGASYLLSISNVFGMMAMCYFFFISGFLFFKGLTQEKYFQKIIKRFKSLIIPFVFWQVVYVVAVSLYLKRFIGFSLVKIFDIRQFPYNAPIWYLNGLFILFIFSYALLCFYKSNFSRKKKLYIILFFAVILLKLININELSSRIGYLNNILTYTSVFLYGTYLGYFKMEQDELQQSTAIMIVTYIISLIFLKSNVINIIYVLFIIIILQSINISDKLVRKTVFSLSFVLYANQAILFSTVVDNMNRYIRHSRIPFLSMKYLLSQILLILLSIIIAYIIKRISNKISFLNKLVTGGR